MTLAFDLPSCPPSPLTRLDPRWKLAALGLAAILCLFLRSAGPTLLALAGALALAPLARLPARWFLLRLGSALLMLALLVVWRPLLPRTGDVVWDLGFLVLSVTGLVQASLLLAKAATLVTLMLVLIATAPLQETLAAAHALRVPGVVVQLANMTYRYVFVLAEEFGRLRIALRVRGYRNRPSRRSYQVVGQVAGSLLVRSHERADRVAQALRCRGFAGRYRCLQRFHAAAADVAALTAIVGFAAGLVVWERLRP